MVLLTFVKINLNTISSSEKWKINVKVVQLKKAFVTRAEVFCEGQDNYPYQLKTYQPPDP